MSATHSYVALSCIGPLAPWSVYAVQPTRADAFIEASRMIDAQFGVLGPDNLVSRRIRENLTIHKYSAAIRFYPYRLAISRYEAGNDRG